MRKKALQCCLICLALLLIILPATGCNYQAKQGNQVIKIGINLELTGRLAQYGNNCLEGIELAVQRINQQGGIAGKRLEYIVYDNGSQSAMAALMTQRLFQKDGVCAIIGPSTSTLLKASLETGCTVPVIAPSATADDLGPKAKDTVFRVCFTDSLQGTELARYAKALGFQKVALLTDTSSDYARGITAAFSKQFTTQGGEITQQKYYTSTDTDFSAVLSSFQLQHTDAFFIPGYYAEAGLIIKQARKLGIWQPVLSGDAFDSPALAEICGDSAFLKGVYFTNHYYPATEKGDVNQMRDHFLNDYQAKYKKMPAAYCALGYDSVWLLCQALGRVSGQQDSGTLKKALYETKDFSGVTGNITLDSSGNAQKNAVLLTFENGVCKLAQAG